MIITGEPMTWAGPPFCRVNTTLYLLLTQSCYTTLTTLVRAGAWPAGISPLEEKPSGDFPKTVHPPENRRLDLQAYSTAGNRG